MLAAALRADPEEARPRATFPERVEQSFRVSVDVRERREPRRAVTRLVPEHGKERLVE